MSTNPPISRPTGLVNYNEKGSLGCGKPSGTLPATDAGAKSLIIGRAWTLADKKPAKRDGNQGAEECEGETKIDPSNRDSLSNWRGRQTSWGGQSAGRKNLCRQATMQEKDFGPERRPGQFRQALHPRGPKCWKNPWTQRLRPGVPRQGSISPSEARTETQE